MGIDGIIGPMPTGVMCGSSFAGICVAILKVYASGFFNSLCELPFFSLTIGHFKIIVGYVS